MDNELHVAVQDSKYDVMESLVVKRPELCYQRNSYGFSPVHELAFFHDFEGLSIITRHEHRALFAKNKKGKSVFDYLYSARLSDKVTFYGELFAKELPPPHAWFFVDAVLPGIERYFKQMPVDRTKALVRLCTKSTKNEIRAKVLSLSRVVRLEPELVYEIVVNSY
jgi:hypothetical protein